MFYQKRPVRIEAFQYNEGPDKFNWLNSPGWAIDALKDGVMYYGGIGDTELFIRTLEGNHHVSIGDFIIQGVHGELYPCKPDIFLETYVLIPYASDFE